MNCPDSNIRVIFAIVHPYGEEMEVERSMHKRFVRNCIICPDLCEKLMLSNHSPLTGRWEVGVLFTKNVCQQLNEMSRYV